MDENKLKVIIIAIAVAIFFYMQYSDSRTEKTIPSYKKPQISVNRKQDVKTIERESIIRKENIHRKDAMSQQENMIEIGTAPNTVEIFSEEELMEKRKQVLLAIEEGFNLIDRELERATPGIK